jgi:hypothetical protein
VSRTDRVNRRVNRSTLESSKADTRRAAAGSDNAGAAAEVAVKAFDGDGLDVDSIELDPVAAEALAAHAPATIASEVPPVQAEQRAMAAVSEALAFLDADARVRVLEWAARTCRVQNTSAATENRPRLRLGRRITDPFLEAGEFDTLFGEPQVPARVDPPPPDLVKKADVASPKGTEPVATLLNSFVEDFQQLARTLNAEAKDDAE